MSEPVWRKAVHELGVGILMLDTSFRRLVGDVGNASTWRHPVQYKIVKGATASKVVYGGAYGLLDSFVEAAEELVGMGVQGIATSCGFMCLYQKELNDALPVPVATSSLLQVPLIETLLPTGKRVGILTFSAESLSPRHLAAVGVSADTPIEGVPADSMFRKVYGDERAEAGIAQLESEVVAAALRLVSRHPEVGAILCECTNMPPHSAAIARATNLPVYDMAGFINWFASSLQPARYEQHP